MTMPAPGRACRDALHGREGDQLVTRVTCTASRWARMRLVISGVSLLETELGNGQPTHVLLITCASPPGQELERRHGPRDASAAGGPHALAHFLALPDRRQPRPPGCPQPPGVPGARG
jgi:hypothetical protein